MDNDKFHKVMEIQKLLRANNITFKYLVPYSPELNPIEEFFLMLKARFNGIRNSQQNITIESSLDNILSERNDFSVYCKGFYRNMRNWLDKARRREYFI